MTGMVTTARSYLRDSWRILVKEITAFGAVKKAGAMSVYPLATAGDTAG